MSKKIAMDVLKYAKEAELNAKEALRQQAIAEENAHEAHRQHAKVEELQAKLEECVKKQSL